VKQCHHHTTTAWLTRGCFLASAERYRSPCAIEGRS